MAQPAEHLLSIGALAERSGVGAATLRMWEQRHGFPTAERLPSGHRRYPAEAVELVRRVASLRDAGLRLDEAVAQVRSAPHVPARSVFADLRRSNPALPVHRLAKRTLIAMSHAIEDEFMARATAPRLFGAFQEQRFYAHAEPRWRDLARRASSTTVLAVDFPGTDDLQAHRPRRVALSPDSPLVAEWAVVCLAEDLPVALTAWELPGQDDVPDGLREFEAVWSLHPSDVSVAARVCAATAGEPLPEMSPVLSGRPGGSAADAADATALFARAVAYLDRRARQPIVATTSPRAVSSVRRASRS
ncbi:DICT sensory domain-containing protein [Nocardioides zeae]|uniref:DICT sensory domain-containing protein n=1 Tax=Nocardioides imazamoxiresistens TaxID=3231893 RepID=A0ABU3Q1K8_9ACTN|nr:DICT sensory domain-containing protein [Nocardioides zeae]MDT9595404.1 DICT sensory domain-containing protein [Nocardioides zeae]